MNIALIGFMGVGKTTVSGVLARLIGAGEIETDELAAEHAGRKIPEIFETEGEEAFRDMETAVISEIAESDGTVISCGGGAVLRKCNVDALKKNGIIVLLTARPETILERVHGGAGRPMLKGRATAEGVAELMEERRGAYEAAADISISTDEKTPEDIAKEIIEKIKERENGLQKV